MSAIYPPDFSFHYSSNSEELNPIQLLGFGAEDAYLRHAERVWADASFTASRLAALACKRLPNGKSDALPRRAASPLWQVVSHICWLEAHADGADSADFLDLVTMGVAHAYDGFFTLIPLIKQYFLDVGWSMGNGRGSAVSA